MTSVVVVAGLVCLISSSLISGSIVSKVRQPEIWSDSLRPTAHENIMVEIDDGSLVNIDNESDDGSLVNIDNESLVVEEKVCEPTDTPCDPEHYSHIASGNVAYMDTCGECHASGECLDGYKLKDDRCWKDLGEPYHDPDFTRDPDARCQGNAQWIDLNYDYYDTKLNCVKGNCAGAPSRFCFRRGTRESCESTAGGYFTEGQNDRIQDCAWITPK
jgi:hypothetical protein